MILVFVTNLIHHHQLPVADEFYRLLGKDYHYISTESMPDWLIKGGYDPTLDRPYIVRSYETDSNKQKALKLIDSADVVIMGAGPIDWVLERKKQNKVTFHYSERWLKTTDTKVLAPYRIYKIYKHYWRFRKSRCYMLCASAFTASDMNFYHIFPNKCFKWGYFTSVENFDYELYHKGKYNDNVIHFMWCARFLDWKHPELPVLLAERLKDKGYKFVIDMFGGGELFDEIQLLVSKKKLDDCVNLRGNFPNAIIIEEMRKHDIFLFTSDRYEGWGAVLNEAMANGCVPIASDFIGSVPYLIKNGINGLTFHSCSLNSLEKAVCLLINNPNRIMDLSKAAIKTMRDVWSPQVAANNFLELAQHAIAGTLDDYNRDEGPASWDR